jgi:hypothetical protein
VFPSRAFPLYTPFSACSISHSASYALSCGFAACNAR